jgi:hypothetical protein
MSVFVPANVSIDWRAAALWLGGVWLLFFIVWGLPIWRGH